MGESDEAPNLPEGIEYGFDQLDKETKAGLRSLNKQLAEAVGNRLIAAAALLAEDDVEGALEQARYARRKASRVAVVREVTGVAAYGAEEWQLAVNELRAAQRLGGTHDHVALIADCERALGHPERAIDLYREFGSDESVDAEVRVELLIVASGARRDMGMGEAATAMLKVGGLNSPKTEPWVGAPALRVRRGPAGRRPRGRGPRDGSRRPLRPTRPARPAPPSGCSSSRASSSRSTTRTTSSRATKTKTTEDDDFEGDEDDLDDDGEHDEDESDDDRERDEYETTTTRTTTRTTSKATTTTPTTTSTTKRTRSRRPTSRTT